MSEITKKEYEYLGEKAQDRQQAIARLDDIVHILRKECPWDREQDHQSLRICMLEEAYETADAIDKEDTENLREELGDVLLQVVFHAILEEENDAFDLTDVINEECEKMIRRHPHVFLDEEAKTVDKVLEKWENIKGKEHLNATFAERLKDVPDALPALMYSRKIQKRAAEAGFDWDDASGAFTKLSEEIKELQEAAVAADQDSVIEELGDVLFSVVNVSRFLGVEPESALKAASAKFTDRFETVEKMAIKEGRNMKDMSLSELDQFWDLAKANEKPE